MTKKIIDNYKFPILLILSVLLGSAVGLIYGSDATVLKPFGDVFLNLMYTIVVPLVFFTVSSSIANMINLKRLGKILYSVFFTFAILSILAALFMLIFMIFIDPVSGVITLEEGTSEALNVGEQIVKAITVTDFNLIFSRSNMLPLIIFSALFGVGTSLINKEGKIICDFLDASSKVMMKVIKIIMYYAPIGLFAFFANLIGEFGPELLGSYAKSMIIYYVVSILFFFIFYTLYVYIASGKKGLKLYFKHVLNPSLTALATQSSLATLPTNLEATENIGVPKDIREVTIPIGTTMHMDGSSMGAILKIAFLFSIFNYEFSGIGTLSIAVLIALLSSIVMSGIPGGGLIGEMLIVSLYNFPLEAFPIIATIGWLIDPPATWLNVTGDTASSMLVTRLVEGKNWLK